MANFWEKLDSPVKGRKMAPNLVNICTTFVNPDFEVDVTVIRASKEREGLR